MIMEHLTRNYIGICCIRVLSWPSLVWMIGMDETKRWIFAYLSEQTLLLHVWLPKKRICSRADSGSSESSLLHSHSHFYHEDFICQFSLLQPAQPPTPNPTIQPYHPAPWRVAAGSQAVHHEAADELHEMYSRDVKYGWSGGGGGGKVNLAWQGFGCCWARTDVSGIYVYALRVTLRRAAWEEAGVWPVHC